jgi:uncharacterized protein YrrD
MYNRNIEQDFWDGYHGQRICIYDDFGQQRDSAAVPNKEFMEIIRTGNIAPWMLHMATLEEKSKTQFNSRCLILTSNKIDYTIESLTQKEAFERRRHVLAKVLPAKAYSHINAKGTLTLDPAKIEKLGDLSEDVYEFQLFDPITNRGEMSLNDKGILEPLTMDYQAMKNLCVSKYTSQFDKSKERIAALRARGERLSAQADVSDVTPETFVLSMMWLERTDDDTEVLDFSAYGVGYRRQSDLRSLAASATSIDGFMLAGYSLLCEVETEFPKQSRLRTLMEKWRDYLLNVIFGIRNKSHAFWREQCSERFYEAVQEIPDQFSRSANSFKKILMQKWKIFSQQGIGTKIAELFVLLSGAIVACTTLAFAFKTIKSLCVTKPPPVEIKPSEYNSEHLFNRKCQVVDILQTYYGEVIDIHDALLIIPSLCFFNCRACSQFKRDVALPTMDCMDDETILHSARVMLKEMHTRHLNSPNYVEFKSKPKPKYRKNPGSDDSSWRDGLSAEKKTDSDNAPTNQQNYRVQRFTAEKKTDSDEVATKQQNYRVQTLEAQAFRDKGQEDLISNKLATNLFKIFATTDGVEKPLVNALFIQGRCAVVPNHAVDYIRKASTIKLRNNFHDQGYEMDTSCLSFYPVLDPDGGSKDATIMLCPTVDTKRTIIKHFVKTQDLCTFKSARGTLLTLTNLGRVVATHCIDVEATAFDIRKQYDLTDASGENSILYLRKSYGYAGGTRPGDCGGPLVVSESSFSRKILGIHVAGKDQAGLSNSITQEDLFRVLEQIPFKAHISMDYGDDIDECVDYSKLKLPEGDFSPIGKLARTYRTPARTDLRHSPIYGEVKEPIMGPAILRPIHIDEILVDPMEKGLKKCAVPSTYIPQCEIDSAICSYKNLLFANTKPELNRILTYEEAISGVTGEEYVSSINRRSSPGYPYVNDMCGSLGKHNWLGSDEYIYDNPQLLFDVNLRLHNAKNNQRTPTLWIDTLKDERVSLQKRAIAKTRVFSAGPLSYLLPFRQYFLGFNAHVMENLIQNEIAVGINAYSLQWHELAMYIQKQGKCLVAGDFSNFDGTLNHQILRSICDLINEWYDDGPLNAKIRHVLWEEVVSSTHIFGDVVYSWTHSQPSGNPCTVIINSLYNSIALRIMWNRIMKDTKYVTGRGFSLYVNLISFGDDNILNIADEVVHLFNQNSITAEFKNIGMIYTNENKVVDGVPFRALSEVSFLKRTFRMSPTGFYVAPWSLDSLLESINWVRKDSSQEESAHAIIETAFMELALHEEPVFSYWTDIIFRACRRKMKKLPLLMTYQDYANLDYSAKF